MVVGGVAQDFLGEYMAGGTLLVLGLSLKDGETHKSRYVATGMHGGVLYIRGEVTNVSKEVKVTEADKTDMATIEPLVKEYCSYFDADYDKIMNKNSAESPQHRTDLTAESTPKHYLSFYLLYWYIMKCGVKQNFLHPLCKFK